LAVGLYQTPREDWDGFAEEILIRRSSTAAVILGLSLLVGCPLCSETELSRILSSQGTRATVSIRDCGATTDFATLVQVGGLLKTDVLAVNGRPELALKWSPDGGTLTITIPGSVLEKDLFVKTRQVRKVSVVIARR
jgi:hypothetical protein